MVNIIEVAAQGIGSELGIRSGDRLLKINGHEITDRLDYRFYVSEEKVDLLIERNGEQILYEIEKEADDQLGLTLEEMKLKACGNNCVFCFVYQNPRGMRKPLYFKDEDYRFSFLYGHYVTMTTMGQKDLQRIVEQRLSPLYVSVHSTEEKTRKLLLGIKRDDHLLEKIDFLTRNGIELHAQIVLCPEINDGPIFDKTIHDLKKFYPGIKSVAVVPLGLTRYRDHLMPMRMHSRKELREMIRYTNVMRQKLKDELGNYFIYLADEFFIKANYPLPDASYYDEFYQIENGVGEFRDLIDRFHEDVLPSTWEVPTQITWVTGELAARPLQESIINPLRRIPNLSIDLRTVKNEFYGQSIQVSGLLVGQDIYAQLKNTDLGDLVLLPPRVLNDEGLFLDDWTVDKLEDRLGVPCHVYAEPLNKLQEVTSRVRRRKTA